MAGQSSDFCGQGLIVYQVTHMRQGRGKRCCHKILREQNDTDGALWIGSARGGGFFLDTDVMSDPGGRQNLGKEEPPHHIY